MRFRDNLFISDKLCDFTVVPALVGAQITRGQEVTYRFRPPAPGTYAVKIFARHPDSRKVKGLPLGLAPMEQTPNDSNTL